MAVTATASASLSGSNLSVSDNESANITISSPAASFTFADGTGAGQINKIWQDTRQLTDGGNETLDFNPTPVSGVTGSVSFTGIKSLLVTASPSNTTNITVTGTLLARPVAVLKPGGHHSFLDPSATGSVVTPTTTDTMIMTNGAGAAASYSVVAAGI